MPDRLTFLGHSTVLLDLGGVRVLTDPVLGHLALVVRRRVAAVLPETLSDLSAVFISHGHWDHLDLASLRALPGRPEIIVPAGLGPLVRKAARGNVRELRVGDRVHLGSLTLEAIHAEHGRRRSLMTTSETALGLLISGSTTTIYFAGDTDLFTAMEYLAGRVDVALLPVGGWGPRLGRGHLDPVRAAEAVVRIRPAIAVPIHWGTLHPAGLRRLVDRGSRSPGQAFRDAVGLRAPAVEVPILAPGDSIALGRP